MRAGWDRRTRKRIGRRSRRTIIEFALVEREEAFGGAEAQQAVLALLEERIRRYTMGDSTSVPIDTATRLLEGIAFCVSFDRNGASALPKDAPLQERFQAGVAEAKRLSRRAKLLLREAQRWQPPVVNTGFRDTLDALPDFFKRYDPDFFAQDMPCSLDYPLCQPVSDALLGVEYLLDYLRRWLAESAFLRAFERERLINRYERYYGDYEDLLVNLYLPAAETAVLCSLADVPPRRLQLDENQRENVLRVVCAADETQARGAVGSAVRRLEQELPGIDAFGRNYLEQTARDLLVRLRSTVLLGQAGLLT